MSLSAFVHRNERVHPRVLLQGTLSDIQRIIASLPGAQQFLSADFMFYDAERNRFRSQRCSVPAHPDSVGRFCIQMRGRRFFFAVVLNLHR